MAEQTKSPTRKGKQFYLTWTGIIATIFLILTGTLQYFDDTLLDFPFNIVYWLFVLVGVGSFMDDYASFEEIPLADLRIRYCVLQTLNAIIYFVLFVTVVLSWWMDAFEDTFWGWPYNLFIFGISFVAGGLLYTPYENYKKEVDRRIQNSIDAFYRRINKEYAANFSDKDVLRSKEMSVYFDVNARKVLFRNLKTGGETLKKFEDIRYVESLWEEAQNAVGSRYYKYAILRLHFYDVRLPMLDINVYSEDSGRFWVSKIEAMKANRS